MLPTLADKHGVAEDEAGYLVYHELAWVASLILIFVAHEQ